MPRCSSCNRLVSVEAADPEFTDGPSLEISEEPVVGDEIFQVNVDAEVRLVKVCAECGDELAEAVETFEYESELAVTHTKPGCTGKITIQEEDISSGDRYEGKGRATKRFYQACIAVTLGCDTCDFSHVMEGTVERQASAFDEL